MFKSSLSEQTPARGPHERASNAPVTRSYPRGAAGFTLSPSTGGTKTGKFTVIPDVTTPLRTGKLVSHDLSSDDRARLDTIIGLLRSAGGGLPEQSIRSTAFQAAAFTVEEAIQEEKLSTESTWFTLYDYLVESDVEALVGALTAGDATAMKILSAFINVFTTALQKSYLLERGSHHCWRTLHLDGPRCSAAAWRT